jgi:uncharacterized Ntn-hydrolase superfamily protein
MRRIHPQWLAVTLAFAGVAALLPCWANAPLSSLVQVPVAERNESDDRWCHTFSVAAYDPEAKEWGVATASRVLAVGSIVPWGKPGMGVVATQSYANLTFGDRGLELLQQGKTAEQVVQQLVDGDAERGVRQLAIVDREGKPAAFTGDDCIQWHGQKLGDHYVCVGNLLAGPEVLDAMSKAFEAAKGPLAWRLVAALEAADEAGGDRRGKQSAALLVVGEKVDPLGYGNTNLRVDDHAAPVKELARLLQVALPRP